MLDNLFEPLWPIIMIVIFFVCGIVVGRWLCLWYRCRKVALQVNDLRKKQLEEEDQFLRKLLEDTPGYPDHEDPTPIAFDENFNWLSAKQLRDRDETSR